MHQAACRRYCHRRQGVEGGQHQAGRLRLTVLLAGTLGHGDLAEPLHCRGGADREPHQHGRHFIAQLVVAVVVRTDRDEHLQLAILHHFAPGREKIVYAGRYCCQQQVVQCDAEKALGAEKVVHSLADDESPPIGPDRSVQRQARCERHLGDQVEKGTRVARGRDPPGTGAIWRAMRPLRSSTRGRRIESARQRPRVSDAVREWVSNRPHCVGPEDGLRGRAGRWLSPHRPGRPPCSGGSFRALPPARRRVRQ